MQACLSGQCGTLAARHLDREMHARAVSACAIWVFRKVWGPCCRPPLLRGGAKTVSSLLLENRCGRAISAHGQTSSPDTTSATAEAHRSSSSACCHRSSRPRRIATSSLPPTMWRSLGLLLTATRQYKRVPHFEISHSFGAAFFLWFHVIDFYFGKTNYSLSLFML